MDTSSGIDSSADSASTARQRKSAGFRWKSGLLLMLIGSGGTLAANRLSPDDTSRMIRTYEGAGLTLLGLAIWWYFFSGVSLRKRLLIPLALIIVSLAAAKATIRKVWFEGDMRPHMEFVWSSPSRSEVAQQWLKEHQPNSGDQQPAATDSEFLEITDADWPAYCGKDGNRRISEPLCSLDWNTHPPQQLWRHPVGDAWSSFTVADNRLYTQEQRGPLECVVCYEASTGTELWRREDAARYESAQGAIGPRATPTLTSGRLFSLGATGILNAIHPVTGKLLWQRNICTDAGSEVLEWGMSGSPLIYGSLVIVDAGGSNGKAVLAYEQATGEIVWAAGNHKAGYATPRLETIGISQQLLVFHGDGLAGMNPDNGETLWEYPWTNQYRINVAQPMRFGTRIFLSSGYDSGCVLLNPEVIRDGRPQEAWPPNKNLKLKFNEAVQKDAFVYGLDDGILACLDTNTGERRWKGGRYRFGQLLLWGDRIVVQAEAGYVAVVEASPEKFREICRLEALNDRTWNMPVVNKGLLFVRNASEAACFRLPQQAEPGSGADSAQ